MKPYTLIKGNLLDAKADYICHQVNCQGVMGSGVAKAIRDKHPEVYVAYLEFVNEHRKSGETLLGKTQFVCTNPDDDTECILNGTKYSGVINMFAQDSYGYDGKQYTSLEAFKKCLEEINRNCYMEIVAFPWMIGCVRGGAKWTEVLPMICETLSDVREIIFYKL